MNRREAMAAYVVSKREPRVVLPSNGICPMSRLPYFSCRCDNHRCGDCGRRWSQRSAHGSTPDLIYTCQCERNRRLNGFPPHWRIGLVSSG
jgi:hypothetical protein